MKSDLLKKEILKKYKSVRNFAETIGIPSSTIQSAIDTDNFDKMSVGRMIKICDALGIDVKTFKPLSPGNGKISADEESLISAYRRLDPVLKQYVLFSVTNAANYWSTEDAFDKAREYIDNYKKATSARPTEIAE